VAAPRAHGAVVATALLVLLLAAVAWTLLGGGWRVVETPSMGTRAPVGSLVQVGRAAVADVAVGDLVVVRPSGTGRTWTHEVMRVHDDGTLSTAGRLSGPDPWRIADDELVGRVTFVVPGVGWVIIMAPLLIALTVVVAVVLRLSRPSWRLPLGIVAAAAAFSLMLVVYHPLEGAQQLAFSSAGEGAVGTWVNTGLLPLRLTPVVGEGAASAVIGTGEVATVAFDAPGPSGRFAVRGTPVVPWPVWVAIAALCFLPAVIETLRRRPRLTG
jgi:hypothetical protein